MLSQIKSKIESLPGSYRFLYTEAASLTSPYIFVGLNPGGSVDDPSDLSIAEGNAYEGERWGRGGGYNPLQKQVLAFFQEMAVRVGVADWRSFMSQRWLISNYVFYRSGRWAEMVAKKEHVEKSKGIWRDIFTAIPPKIIVCNGHDTYANMKAMLCEQGWAEESERRSLRAWDGPHIAVLVRHEQGHRCVLIGFAHLSTFKVIKRPENAAIMEEVYAAIAAGM